MRSARTYACAIAVALQLCPGPGFAQQSPGRLEEQKIVLSGFYWRFVRPLDACAIAGPEMLKKAQALVDAVRRRYPKTFEVVERHPVYIGTVVAARAMDADRYKPPGGNGVASRDCTEGIAVLRNPHAKDLYDDYMHRLLELLSTST